MSCMRGCKIVLLSCARKKLSTVAQAQDLYASPLFRLSLAYAKELKPDAIFILSAKYGLLRPEEIVAWYDETLNAMTSAGVRTWAVGVLSDLSRIVDLNRNEFVLLAGERYRRFIEPELRHVRVPLRGLAIGKQLQFLKRALSHS